MARGKSNKVAFSALPAGADAPVAVGDADLPRPQMRVLQSDAPAPVIEAPALDQALIPVTISHEKPVSIYRQLDALIVGHLRGGHSDYAVLHPILVALATAKNKANEALEYVHDPATRDLLQKIKAL